MVEGSYGTGKSRVVWALKNLLECSEKEFRDYFEKNHDEFKKVPDLEDKLFAQRSGKIVTVFRYNSGEITTIKKFITAVFDSVSDALDNAGIAYNGNKTRVVKLSSGFQTMLTKHISTLLFLCRNIALWAA